MTLTVELMLYRGCTIAVYHNGIVVTTPDGEIEGFDAMSTARRWIRRRERQAA